MMLYLLIVVCNLVCTFVTWFASLSDKEIYDTACNVSASITSCESW